MIPTHAMWLWAILNLGAGIWEIYAFQNRNKLKLETITLWEKISKCQINIRNFWIEGWSEYCKVDSRYIYKQYVWGFELLNAVLAIMFIIALTCKSYITLKLVLGISIINCLIYFITLFWEVYFSSSIENIIKENMKKYAKKWMFPIYYLISGIWLIVPWWLYIHLQ
jgi:hypothetical protein